MNKLLFFNRKVVVGGGTGFVGSEVCRLLRRNHYEVVVVSRFALNSFVFIWKSKLVCLEAKICILLFHLYWPGNLNFTISFILINFSCIDKNTFTIAKVVINVFKCFFKPISITMISFYSIYILTISLLLK